MFRCVFVVGAVCLVAGAVLAGQAKTVPRPPAQAPGQAPAGESAAPDGYQPLPQWLGQTRAPAPAKTEAFTVQTFAEGLNGAAFQFLPDGRILLGERNGRIRIIGKDGKPSEPLAGMPADMYTPARASSACSQTGPSRRTAPSISPMPCCRQAPIRRSSARPRTCMSRARGCRRTRNASKA